MPTMLILGLPTDKFCLGPPRPLQKTNKQTDKQTNRQTDEAMAANYVIELIFIIL